LDEECEASELVFLGVNKIPTDNPSLQGFEDMVFSCKRSFHDVVDLLHITERP